VWSWVCPEGGQTMNCYSKSFTKGQVQCGCNGSSSRSTRQSFSVNRLHEIYNEPLRAKQLDKNTDNYVRDPVLSFTPRSFAHTPAIQGSLPKLYHLGSRWSTSHTLTPKISLRTEPCRPSARDSPAPLWPLLMSSHIPSSAQSLPSRKQSPSRVSKSRILSGSC
jgi:hypothetical protein